MLVAYLILVKSYFSQVIAYAMKAYGWSLEEALIYVKDKRNCVTPNKGFMEQLQTFDGILKASSNRHKIIFKNSWAMSPSFPGPSVSVRQDFQSSDTKDEKSDYLDQSEESKCTFFYLFLFFDDEIYFVCRRRSFLRIGRLHCIICSVNQFWSILDVSVQASNPKFIFLLTCFVFYWNYTYFSKWNCCAGRRRCSFEKYSETAYWSELR